MFIAMLAATALFAGAAPAAAPASQPAKPAASDIVCHKEYPTGSNIPTKVCRSKSEEAANRAEARKQLEQMQLTATRPPGG